MNCPSRTDEPEGTGYNQNPSPLAADLTTRQDLNGIANSRVLRRIAIGDPGCVVEPDPDDNGKKIENAAALANKVLSRDSHVGGGTLDVDAVELDGEEAGGSVSGQGTSNPVSTRWLKRLQKVVTTFGKFVGPGFMASSLPSLRHDHAI